MKFFVTALLRLRQSRVSPMDCRTSPVTGSSRFKKSMRRVTGEKHPQAGCRTVTRGKDWANRFLCLVILPGAGSSAAATEPLTGRFLVFLSRLTTGRHVRPTALLDIGCGWGEWLPTALRAAARKGRLQGKVLYQGLDIARRPIRHLQRDFRKKEADFFLQCNISFCSRALRDWGVTRVVHSLWLGSALEALDACADTLPSLSRPYSVVVVRHAPCNVCSQRFHADRQRVFTSDVQVFQHLSIKDALELLMNLKRLKPRPRFLLLSSWHRKENRDLDAFGGPGAE